MHLQLADWIIVAASLLICFVPALFFGKRAGQEHLGVLRLRTGRPVVAGRSLHGRHDLQQRHAQPRHRHRPAQRGGRQLGVVGVRADRRRDGLLLCAPVAAVGGDDGPGVLRDPLLRQGRERGARVSRGVPRPAVQLHDHGDGQPGRVQDRRRAVRVRALADARVRGRAERRVRDPLGPLGRPGHRHDPVLHQDDGGDRGRLLRGDAAPGRAG